MDHVLIYLDNGDMRNHISPWEGDDLDGLIGAQFLDNNIIRTVVGWEIHRDFTSPPIVIATDEGDT